MAEPIAPDQGPEDKGQDKNQEQPKQQSSQDQDAGYWKAEAKKAFEARQQAVEEARALKEFKAKIDSERREQAEQAERKSLEEQGKYQEAIERTKAKHQQEMQQFRSQVHQRLVPAAIKAAAAKIDNIVPDAMDYLPQLVGTNISLNENFEPVVLDEKGQPMVDEDLRPITVDEYVKERVLSMPFLLVDGTARGSGVRPQRSGGSPTRFTVEAALSDQKLMAEWKEADPEGFDAAMKEFMSTENAVKVARERYEKRRK